MAEDKIKQTVLGLKTLKSTIDAMNETDLPALGKSIDEVSKNFALQTKEIQKQANFLGEEYNRYQDLIESAEAYAAKLDKTSEAYDEQIKQLDKLERKYRALNKVQETTVARLNNIGIQASYTKTWLGDLTKLTAAHDGLAAAIKASSKTIGETLKQAVFSAGGAMNVGNSIMRKMIEMTVLIGKEYSNARAEFFKSTAATADYSDELVYLGSNYRDFNVGLDRARESMKTLYADVPTYTKLTLSHRRQLEVTVSQLDAAGISAITTAKSFDILMGAFRKSPEVADKLIKELFATSRALEMPPNIIFEEYGNAQESIAAWGEKSIEIFKRVAAQSKATTVSIGSLLKLSDQMNTFAGAAGIAGKMNAAMGGNFLNALELLNADPDKKIMLVKQAFDKWGGSWKALNMQEQMMIAGLTGLSVSEASRFFSGSTDEMRKYMEQTKQLEISQQELKDAIRLATPVFDKMRQAMASFAIAFKPITDMVEGALSAFVKFDQMVARKSEILSWVLKLATSVGLMAGGFFLLRKSVQSVTGTKEIIKTLKNMNEVVSPKAATAGGGFFGGIKSLDPVQISAVGKSLLQFGAAILLIGGGIALATWGISHLATALNADNWKGVTLITATLSGMVIGLALLSKFAAAGGAGLIVFGAGIAAIGGGIAAVAWGVSNLADSIERISKVDVSKLASVASSMKDIVSPGIFGGIGTMLSSVGYMGIAAAANMMPTTPGIPENRVPVANISPRSQGTQTVGESSVQTGNKQPIVIKLMLNELELGETVVDLWQRHFLAGSAGGNQILTKAVVI